HHDMNLKSVLTICVFSMWLPAAHAAVTGSISGALTDPSGAFIPGATLTVTNTAQGIVTKTNSGAEGSYAFPSLPVGKYELVAEATGFRPEKRTQLVIDTDTSRRVDLVLQLAQRREEVTVVGNLDEEIHVETVST